MKRNAILITAFGIGIISLATYFIIRKPKADDPSKPYVTTEPVVRPPELTPSK